MAAIYKKEVRSYFTSMIGCVFIAFALGIISLYFYAVNLSSGYPYLGYSLSATMFGFLAIALGLFISSITESQVIAAVVTFLILFVSYMAEAIAKLIPSTAWVSFAALAIVAAIVALIVYYLTQSFGLGLIVAIVGIGGLLIKYLVNSSSFEGLVGDLISSLSLTAHFNNFVSGIIDIPGIIFYLSGSFLFLFLSVQAVEKRRWC